MKVLKAASKSDPKAKSEGALQETLLEDMTTDEVLMIYDEWLKGCEKVNPRVEAMTKESIQAMVLAVKKSPSALIDCSFWQLTNLVRYLLQTQDPTLTDS